MLGDSRQQDLDIPSPELGLDVLVEELECCLAPESGALARNSLSRSLVFTPPPSARYSGGGPLAG
jgi:hypothetical protein